MRKPDSVICREPITQYRLDVDGFKDAVQRKPQPTASMVCVEVTNRFVVLRGALTPVRIHQ